MNDLNTVGALGFTLPTPAYLIGMLLLSIIGLAAYRYGKKASRPATRWIGLALMLYLYAVSATWALYAVGGALCAAMYWAHQRGN